MKIVRNVFSSKIVRYQNNPKIARGDGIPFAVPISADPLLNTDGEPLLNTDGQSLFNTGSS